jgi:hypothetical protein
MRIKGITAVLTLIFLAGLGMGTIHRGQAAEEPNLGTNALFIEAEDFNYSDDGITGGLHANFGDPDCSLAGKDAVLAVDYFEVFDSNDSPDYRAPTGVETRPETGDSARGDRTITCDYIVGWNFDGDWYNYTREFGASARYNVYARMASGGPSMNAELARIHGDPTSTNQIKEILGIFASPPTGGWNVFHYVPLRDGDGNLVSVPLDGLTTLRFTVLPGGLDFNYLVFVQAEDHGTPTTVTSVQPPPNSEARAPLIVATLTDGDIARVVPSSIKLTFDGTDVTAFSTIADTGSGAEISYQAPEGSPAGTVHTVRVDWTDDLSTPRMESFTWNYTEGINNAGQNLFIEAEDFNYSDDGITGGLHANFGDADCSLLGKDAVPLVDYFEVVDSNDSPEYRAPTGVETRPETGDSARGDRTITCDYVVGWNFDGDWYNYTRDFGASTRYNVYARLASGGDSMNAELARIHGDHTGTNQTKEVLGTFASPPTGGWNAFHYVALRDGQGNVVSVRLDGLTTLRFTVLPGTLDFNYLVFVKADIQEAPTRVTSVEPRANSDYARAPLIMATLTDGDIARVVPSSIKLTFDGTDVTAGLAIVDTEAGAQVSYQAPEGSPTGTVHTVRLEWMDDSPTPRMESFAWNYTEGIYNTEKNLFIEIEDFNTASGLAFPSFGRVPFNTKGLYNTLGATTGIDFNDSGNPEGDVYRNGEVPNVGMTTVDDAYKGGAGPRPGFEAVPDYRIGWADSNADWYNYTRNYRAGGTYEIYLRASHGDIFATIGGRLELIDDPASAMPEKTFLGTFVAPATGDWNAFTFVPLRDANGEIARVRLQGVRTLRFTVEAAFTDLNYLMLCPTGP